VAIQAGLLSIHAECTKMMPNPLDKLSSSANLADFLCDNLQAVFAHDQQEITDAVTNLPRDA
jgi:hypothetical protein